MRRYTDPVSHNRLNLKKTNNQLSRWHCFIADKSSTEAVSSPGLNDDEIGPGFSTVWVLEQEYHRQSFLNSLAPAHCH